MTMLPRRTHATSLTDGELLILDWFFDKASWVDPVYREDYASHANTEWTHDIEDSEVDAVIERFTATGILRRIEPGGPFTVDVEGGHLWELERRPDWTTYVSSWHLPSPPGFCAFAERCMTRGIALRALGSAISAGLLKRHVPPLQHWVVKDDATVLSWKTFPVMHYIRVVFPGDHPIPENSSWSWVKYDRRRKWWNNVQQLQTLR